MTEKIGPKKSFGMKFNALALVIVLVMGVVVIYESDDSDSDVQPQAVYTYSASGYVVDEDGAVIEDMVVSGDMTFTVMYRSEDILCCSFISNVIATDGTTEIEYSVPYLVYLDADTFAPYDVPSSGKETLSTIFGDVECERYVEDMSSYLGEKLTLYSNSDDKTIYRFDITSEKLLSDDPVEKCSMYIKLELTDRHLELGIFGTSSTIGKTSTFDAAGTMYTYDDSDVISTDLTGKIVITKVADSIEATTGMAVQYYTMDFTMVAGDTITVLDLVYGVRSDGTVLGAEKTYADDGRVAWILDTRAYICVGNEVTICSSFYAIMLDAREDTVGGLMFSITQTNVIVDGEFENTETTLMIFATQNMM